MIIEPIWVLISRIRIRFRFRRVNRLYSLKILTPRWECHQGINIFRTLVSMLQFFFSWSLCLSDCSTRDQQHFLFWLRGGHFYSSVGLTPRSCWEILSSWLRGGIYSTLRRFLKIRISWGNPNQIGIYTPAHMGSNHEKNLGKKSRDKLLMKRTLTFHSSGC